MKPTLPLALLLGSLFSLASSRAASAQALLSGTVERVIGGDDVLVNIDGQTVQVDLVYIRPPIGSLQAERQARNYLEELLPPGTPVQLDVAWRASDGRLFAYVYSSDGLVNLKMLEAGRSVAPWQLPNPVLQTWYSEAQTYAQANQLGVWQAVESASMAQAATPLPGGIPAWSVGGAVAVVSLGLLAQQWRRKGAKTQPLKQELRKLQGSLAEHLTEQKHLERQLQAAKQQVEVWVERAKLALQNDQEDLARQALLRKQAHLKEVERLQRSLDAVVMRVETTRIELAGLGSPSGQEDELD
ncbi:PspA/IM30 family protein [Synechococcus sp. Nb3U1]|uniref:PspA/IM30 family protein n=1 Tax=Synechococcus sp. Nb3U1 TaxID=1914529 RepID=UPI001F34AA8B|nr:PspA/IM30 family protein [Synechococcus sp. Nb3U1]MCF2971502.1 PspA/IM30 family protein [Synechococcus sp. Nb3U1]